MSTAETPQPQSSSTVTMKVSETEGAAPVNPLATRTWWIAHAIMWLGVILGTIQATLTDYAKAHPENTSAAIALVVVALSAKAVVSHGESGKAAALLLACLLFLTGCVTDKVKQDVADASARFHRFYMASRPAPSVDPDAWKAAGDATERTLQDADLGLNGPRVASPTAH